MSETKELTKESNEVELLEQLAIEEKLEITIRKGSNEVTIRNPRDNRIVRLKANVEDAIQEQFKEQEDDDTPLTPEEFEKALRKVDALGLTFTPELFPSVVPKPGNQDEVLNSDKFEYLEENYPYLPREVGLVVYNVLTSSNIGLDSIGGLESLEKKSKIVKELIITTEFRDEFFFRHALKVPYFESIDWEVNLKTHERGVEGMVGVPYALLMLTFHNPNPRVGRLDVHQNITVAVNRYLIDKLLAALTEVRVSLEASEKMREVLRNTKSLKE